MRGVDHRQTGAEEIQASSIQTPPGLLSGNQGHRHEMEGSRPLVLSEDQGHLHEKEGSRPRVILVRLIQMIQNLCGVLSEVQGRLHEREGFRPRVMLVRLIQMTQNLCGVLSEGQGHRHETEGSRPRIVLVRLVRLIQEMLSTEQVSTTYQVGRAVQDFWPRSYLTCTYIDKNAPGKEFRGKEFRGKEFRGKEFRGKEFSERDVRGKEFRGKKQEIVRDWGDHDSTAPQILRHSKPPITVPYTTAASQFLYGTSAVVAALKAQRRKAYTLYLLPGSDGTVEEKRETETVRKLALTAGAKVKVVTDEWLPTLDKMCAGRPHNVRFVDDDDIVPGLRNASRSL